jgi:hypothetical protein
MAEHRSFRLTTTPKDDATQQPSTATGEKYSDRPRCRWALWCMVIGVVVVMASVAGCIFAFTAPSRMIAHQSGASLSPSEVANSIVVSLWWTYLAIATGIVGLGVAVTGVIGWFVRR